MPGFSFKELEIVCRRLGLLRRETVKGIIWEGFDINGNYLYISVHMHAKGRDIPKGTLNQIIKRLRFKNEHDFLDFINDKKRRR